MVGKAEALEAVGPLLLSQIQEYEATLDIVERPSVGSLVAPASTCTLIYQFLGYALYSFTPLR